MSKEKAIAYQTLYKYRPFYTGDNENPEDNGIAYSNLEETKEIKDESLTFIMPSLFGYSDYSGSLVEKANHDSLVEYAKENDLLDKYIFEIAGSHGSESIAVRLNCPDEEVWAMLCAVTDYPLLDEDKHSELEMEAQEENWDNWASSDFRKGVVGKFEELYDLHMFQCKSAERAVTYSRDHYNAKHKRLTEDPTKWDEANYRWLTEEAKQEEAKLYTEGLAEIEPLRKAWTEACSQHCKVLDTDIDNAGNLREVFEDVRERANEYWVNESGTSMYINVDKIVEEMKIPDLMRLLAQD